jgi:hypothetical protein
LEPIFIGCETPIDGQLTLAESKAQRHQALIQKRKLLVNIHTLTFAPAITNLEASVMKTILSVTAITWSAQWPI